MSHPSPYLSSPAVPPPDTSSSGPASSVPSRRRRWLVLGSVAVVAMLLGTVAATALLLTSDRVGQSGHRYNVRVLLAKDITPEQRTAVQARLSDLPSAEQLRFMNREQAFKEFQETYKDKPDVTAGVTIDLMSDNFNLITTAELFDCAAFIPVSHLPGVAQLNIVQLSSQGKEEALVDCPGMRTE